MTAVRRIALGALAMTQGLRSAALIQFKESTIQSGWAGKRRKIIPTNPKSGPMTMANESLLSRPPLRSSLRWGVAIAAIIAADAHIPIIPDHLHEAPYMGTLFVLLTVTCVGLAAVVLVHDVPLVYVAAVTVCGLAILGYAATRTVAFPQLADDVGNWLEPLGIVALCSEATVIGLSLAALRRTRSGAHTTTEQAHPRL